jgi:hypothetical protein
MPIKLKSAGGGGVILDSASTGVDVTLTLPTTAGTITTNERLSASSGASLVGYTPATGSATDVQTRLRLLDTQVSAIPTTTTTSGGASGGGTDKVFYENDSAVTTNYSITAGKNALSAGPVTINNGVSVTIPTGSSWSVV